MKRHGLSIAAAFLMIACSSRHAVTVRPTLPPPAPSPSVSLEAVAPAPASLPPARFADDPIAILPLNNNTGDAKLDRAGRTLAELMTGELSRRPGLRLVERERLSDVLKELRLAETAPLDLATAVRVGRLLGAGRMVFGSFSALGNGMVLTARVVRVETGEIVRAVAKKGANDGALEAMARAAIDEALTLPPAEAADPAVRPADELEGSLPEASRPRPDALGVIVSVGGYKSKDVPAAEFAHDDARLMKLYLTRSLGYLEENLIELRDPSKAELEMVFGGESDSRGRLARLLDQRERVRTEVFVYYSGHGAPGLKDKNAYLVPADANPDYIELNGYSRDLLLGNLAKLGAKRITVVLEACFSGGSGGGTLVRGASPLALRAAESPVPDGVSFIAAASGGQVASWFTEKRHSLFTYHLIKALSDPSAAALGWPELSRRIARDVSSQAARRYNRDQTPQFMGADPRSR